MKILFIYPDVTTTIINFCPAVHILSAVLKGIGCEVNLLHINDKYGIKYDKNTVVTLAEGFDLYAITATSFNYKYANEIAGWLKVYGKPVVLGGCHATIQPEDFDSSNFDIFCVGEGEEPMKDLVLALQEGKDWNKIPNLITRQGINPVRPFIKDLNELPFHDFDITDTERILELRNGFLSISFSRGCPFECTFCINHLYKIIEKGNCKMSEYLRRRSPENTIAELESLAKKYQIKFFNTDDDLLLMDKKWMREFTRLYEDRIYKPFGIKYLINARATEIDEEMVKMLASSGCHEVRIGVETGSERLRNELLNKKISNKSLITAFSLLRKYKVRSLAFLMMGIPQESWSTYYDTVMLIIKLQPTLIRMTYLYPYKHTKIYDYCVEHSLFKDKEVENEFYDSPLKFENITDSNLFRMKFLFPWYVNTVWHTDYNYANAIFSAQLDIPEIIKTDKKLSANCEHPHYRYFSNNDTYFELNDNF